MRALPAILQSEQGTPVGVIAEPELARSWEHDYRALLISQGHRRRNGVWIEGGPFYTEYSRLRNQRQLTMPGSYYYGVSKGEHRFTGVEPLRLRRVPSVGSSPTSPGLSVKDAQSVLKSLQGEFYTRGILRTRPGRPEAGVGQFLAELRDFPKVPGRSFLDALRGLPLKGVIPAIQARSRDFARLQRAVGNEFLNAEFGWRPFLADLREFRNFCKRVDASIQKLVDENRKNIRRRTSFGTATTVLPSVAGAGSGAFAIPMASCGGGSVPPGSTGSTVLTRATRTETRTWFVAGYRYYTTDTSSWLWKGRAAAVLYGAFPTPELVYAITPWSWLVDWFEDLGSLAGFFSPTAVDALVTRYAFTMRSVRVWEECVAQTTIEPAATSNRRWQGCAGVLRTIRESGSKQRGFGWAPFGSSQNLPSLTQKQVAILAAIGTTR